MLPSRGRRGGRFASGVGGADQASSRGGQTGHAPRRTASPDRHATPVPPSSKTKQRLPAPHATPNPGHAFPESDTRRPQRFDLSTVNRASLPNCAGAERGKNGRATDGDPEYYGKPPMRRRRRSLSSCGQRRMNESRRHSRSRFPPEFGQTVSKRRAERKPPLLATPTRQRRARRRVERATAALAPVPPQTPAPSLWTPPP